MTDESKPPKRYLIQNPIKIIENKISQTNNGVKLELAYPLIDGLIDLTIQNSINKDIKGYADRLIMASEIYRKNLREVRLHYSLAANYNNILCVNIYQYVLLDDDNYSMQETLLYELVNGTRLEMKDLFSTNADFPRILNMAIEEYIIKNNLEEQMLKAPFKGIREGQNYQLSESRLNILYDKNDEITTTAMLYGPGNITFRLEKFNGLVDIYDKYSNPGKKIYQNDLKKKKMIPNYFEEKYMSTGFTRDNFRATVSGRIFSGMKNKEFEKKLNEICSYTGENEFKKLLPADLKKTGNYSDMPYIMRNYLVTANYCDVISIGCRENYKIPEGKSSDSEWHINYNVLTGKKLELQDIFKKQYDWKRNVKSYIKEEVTKRGTKFDDSEVDIMLAKADFWFDEERLWINLKPGEQRLEPRNNANVFIIPFEYFGEENLSIRE